MMFIKTEKSDEDTSKKKDKGKGRVSRLNIDEPNNNKRQKRPSLAAYTTFSKFIEVEVNTNSLLYFCLLFIV